MAAHTAGLTAAPPAGRRSDMVSEAPPTKKLSLPPTVPAPPLRVHGVVPASASPPGTAVYQLSSPNWEKTWEYVSPVQLPGSSERTFAWAAGAAARATAQMESAAVAALRIW